MPAGRGHGSSAMQASWPSGKPMPSGSQSWQGALPRVVLRFNKRTSPSQSPCCFHASVQPRSWRQVWQSASVDTWRSK